MVDTTSPHSRSAIRRDMRLSKKKIISALKATGGMISPAAKKLGCSRQSLYQWIQKDEKIAEALETVREENLDFVETQLLQAAKNGQSWAVCFYLKCMGKARGFSEKVDAHVTGDLKVEIKQFGKGE